ncbi:MAG TPA: response regulator transcription factor [Thermomicrobiales bacterium]|nr:response regulator transcription factor [Thermomicrobiales bacterium]
MSRSTQQPLVLVVDDEFALQEAIAYSLRREGWQVEIAHDGVEAIRLNRELDPDLIVLDVMLPGMDGLQVCRSIRASSNVPVLFLSAKGEDVDRILGLEIGGDDYLTKPFVMRELVARVRAHLRRSQRQPSIAAPEPSPSPPAGLDIRRLGPIELDPAAHTVRVSGEPVTLKPKEFDLLRYLLEHPNVTISREALLRHVWKYEHAVDTRTVDVHVRGLRQKIEPDPAEPVFLTTVRGYGYRLAAPENSPG